MFTIKIGSLTISFGSSDPLDKLEKLVLVRHGLSTGNTREEDARDIGDHNLRLAEKGIQQARRAGQLLGKEFLQDSLLYRSPYRRTRETLDNMLLGAGLEPKECRLLEDIRLREVEHGYDNVQSQEEMRAIHGWLFYRFKGGESPADCYDRTSSVLESILRQLERKKKKNATIVTHGLTIRCFVTRFLHLTVEEFESLANPDNCDIITIARKEMLNNPVFTCGRWGVEGVKTRTRPERI